VKESLLAERGGSFIFKMDRVRAVWTGISGMDYVTLSGCHLVVYIRLDEEWLVFWQS